MSNVQSHQKLLINHIYWGGWGVWLVKGAGGGGIGIISHKKKKKGPSVADDAFGGKQKRLLNFDLISSLVNSVAQVSTYLH